jgi:hypothetical protein
MLYRISIILNSVLYFLFIFLALFALIVERDFSNLSLTIVSAIFLSAGISLWFNFSCSKVNKMNKERAPVSDSLRITGRVLFTLNILNVLAILFLIIAAIVDLYSKPVFDGERISPFMIFVLLVIFVVALSAVVNLIFYTKAFRKNKVLVYESINEIGTI